MSTSVKDVQLPASLRQVLHRRGSRTPRQLEAILTPSLENLESPDVFSQMAVAVARLREAIRQEEPVAIYADRDVDGLTGLAILGRTLRTLGAPVHCGSPLKGRGLERAVIESLIAKGAKVLIFVDCGTGEMDVLKWLAAQGIDVIVADHHRMSAERPPALAWIHPGVMTPAVPQPILEGGGTAVAEPEAPAGCVMAFKLSQALWQTFIGLEDPERLQYFLFDHLDLVALGILADRVPLTGENRVLVWHGLRRLRQTRKAGLAALLRFLRLADGSGPVSVREATWQIIPMLNAAGRLGRPEVAAELLMTEDSWAARECIDSLIALNAERRTAQTESLGSFTRAVREQCSESDSVLVAIARDLEPSVTGLAAQSLVRQYGRPAFLFVDQGEESVGSGRGTPEVDLFAWVEAHQDLVVKFGGHHGAVGLTLRTENVARFRERLLSKGNPLPSPFPKEGKQGDFAGQKPEASVALAEADASWWEALQILEPLGQGFPMPVFEITGVESIRLPSRRSKQNVILSSGAFEWAAQIETGWEGTGQGPWTVTATPERDKKGKLPFKWIVLEVHANHD